MVSLIHKIKSEGKERKRNGYGLVIIEELLFWCGLGAVVFDSGWILIVGVVALGTAIALTIYMFACT